MASSLSGSRRDHDVQSGHHVVCQEIQEGCEVDVVFVGADKQVDSQFMYQPTKLQKRERSISPQRSRISADSARKRRIESALKRQVETATSKPLPTGLMDDQPKPVTSERPAESRPVSLFSLLRESDYLFTKLEGGIREDGILERFQDLQVDEEGCSDDPTTETDNFWLRNQLDLESLNEKQACKVTEIVEKVRSLLHSAANSAANDNDSGGSTQTFQHPTGQPPQTPSNTGPPSTNSSRKRKLGHKRDSNGNDSDSDREDDPRKPSKTARRESRVNPRFACPFFKRSPQNYMNERACLGPGFESVHRVKEHLYRRHRTPQFRCNRCSWDFRNSQDLALHHRAPQPCELREETEQEGVTPEQFARLKSRRREVTSKPENEKWIDMYRILFPDDDPSDVPTPYYEYPTTPSKKNNNSACATTQQTDDTLDLLGYAAYLEAELPRALREELERLVEIELDVGGPDMQSRLVKLMQSLQPKLLKSFLQTQGISAPQQLLSLPSNPLAASERTTTRDNTNTVIDVEMLPGIWSDDTQVSSEENTQEQHSGNWADYPCFFPPADENALAFLFQNKPREASRRLVNPERTTNTLAELTANISHGILEDIQLLPSSSPVDFASVDRRNTPTWDSWPVPNTHSHGSGGFSNILDFSALLPELPDF